ncbi:MAG TPA: copper amine oxidase N-terminal domain-containing protein, partial [Clostridiales bacterium]|nr:copper amine oxidase N-terminal domain-containing protein [Clostridiales bacterium]
TSIDGRVVSLGNMPSIIVDNVTMVRAKRVFADTEIAAKYSYNKNDNTVTLSTSDTTLVMKIGSTTAHLNGNPVEMSAAAMIVTNHEVKTNFIMVPGSFTASTLGYDYKWNQSDRMSELTSSVQKPSPGNQNEDSNSKDNSDHVNEPDTKDDNITPVEPELGDSSVVWNKGTILNQWLANDILIGKGSNKQSISGGSTDTKEAGTVLSIVETSYLQKINAETFQFYASKPYGNITSELKNNTITIQIPAMNSYDQTYYPTSLSNSVVKDIASKYNSNTASTVIEVKLRQDDVTYDLSLSPDKMSLYLNVYRNSITSAAVGSNDLGDYITLTAMKAMDPKITTQNGYIILDLPYTANGLQEQFTMVNGGKHINQIYIMDLLDRTQVFLGLKGEVDYYIIENGSAYTVSIQRKNSNYKPPTPVEEKPVVDIDGKTVEIVIPKPDGLGIEMISDKDLYLKKQFIITLPGDYTTYFSGNPISVNSNIIKNFKVSLNNSNQTEICFTTTKIQGYEYTADDKFIYINIDDPKNIYENIVVLDPGHGGGAHGAKYFSTKEKDINFNILYTIAEKYF